MNLGHGNFEDKNVREHRDGFTQLVRELRADPRLRLKNLMLTVLPNVNVPGKLVTFYHIFFSCIASNLVAQFTVYYTDCVI